MDRRCWGNVKKKTRGKIPVRGIEPLAAAGIMDRIRATYMKGGNVSRYTIPDVARLRLIPGTLPETPLHILLVLDWHDIVVDRVCTTFS